MGAIDLFIKRPILSMAFSLAIVLLGLLGYARLPVRQFPVVGDTFITIETRYPGASADTLEDYVTTPITASITGLDGIDYIRGENKLGESVVTVKLFQGYDPDRALTEINTCVDSVLWRLPEGVLSPVISKNFTTSPCIFFNFKSKTLPPEIISHYLQTVVVPQFQSLEGVRTMLYHGKRTLAMRIWLDPSLMAGHDVTPFDVVKGLKSDNVRSTAGRMKNGSEEYDVTVESELSRPGQFDRIVIRSDPDYLLRLKDVGKAELGASRYRVSALDDDGQVVVLGVVPHDRAHSIRVTDEILKLVPRIEKALPSELEMSIPWIPSQISQQAVKTVFSSAWLAVLCVLVVIFLFLGSFRSIWIPSITIPCSLIGVCGLLYLLDYSINTLTLLGGVLAIGLVVDDAIVVLENVYRHMDQGLPAREAASSGTREIALSVVVMTLTVAIVFGPIGLLPGLSGALFHQFAFTIACTVLLSGLFALTLSPMMCATLLRPMNPDSPAKRVERIWKRVEGGYGRLLNGLADHKICVAVAVALVLVLGCRLFMDTHSELIPDEKQGVILGMGIGPTTASLDYSEKCGKEFARIFANVPEKRGYAVICGWPDHVNHITGLLVLRSPLEGDRTEAEILADLEPQFAAFPGLEAFVMNRPPLLDIMGVTSPVNFVLTTDKSYIHLNEAMAHLLDRAKKNPGFVGIRTDLNLDKPGLRISIDRDKASSLGISVGRIAKSLNILMGQPIIGWFSVNGWGYPVIPQVSDAFRQTPQALQNMKIRTADGDLVELGALVDVTTRVQPQSLSQFQQMRSATLTANLAPGYTLGQALGFLKGVATGELSDDIHFDTVGASREFIRSGRLMTLVFLACLVAVYLMLASQFNSLLDPLIIMISVPLSVTGALAAMKLSHGTLNIYTEVGLVMLIGLISKHGILIVSFANSLLLQGHSARESILEASKTRFRPILMTTCAMVFGAVPLVLARGGGHESINQIGVVIIGGLCFGTLLTLFVVPLIYLTVKGADRE